MEPSPSETWSRRFLKAIFPPMPDWLWAGFLLLLVFLVGLALGHLLCMWTHRPLPL